RRERRRLRCRRQAVPALPVRPSAPLSWSAGSRGIRMNHDQVVLAVDGGNSKTDLALVRADGEVLGLARGPLSSPHHLGLDGALDVLQRLFDQASREAGLARNGAVATIAQLLMAGVDFPSEEEELRAAVASRGWA